MEPALISGFCNVILPTAPICGNYVSKIARNQHLSIRFPGTSGIIYESASVLQQKYCLYSGKEMSKINLF